MGSKFCFLFQRRKIAQSINQSINRTTYVLQVITTQPPGEKNTFTVSLAARADGTKLPAVIVFKASNVKTGVLSPGTMKKLDIADNVMVWSSLSGWWNERLDHMWIDHTFGNSEAEGNTVLIRDQFAVHKKDSSAEKLEELGVDQVQSIDQSINQSIDGQENESGNQSINKPISRAAKMSLYRSLFRPEKRENSSRWMLEWIAPLRVFGRRNTIFGANNWRKKMWQSPAIYAALHGKS